VSKLVPLVQHVSDPLPECAGVHIDVVCTLPGLVGDAVVYLPSFSFLWVGEDCCVHGRDELFVVDEFPALTDHVHLVFQWIIDKWHPEVGQDGVGGTQIVVDIHLGVLYLHSDAACCVEGVFIIDIVVEPEIFVGVVVESGLIVWEDLLDDVAHLEVTEELVDVRVVPPGELGELRVDGFYVCVGGHYMIVFVIY